jgi:hypothetical protein
MSSVKTAHRLWRNELLPGTLPFTLPTPDEYEAASGLVTEDMVRERFLCGPDPQRYLDQVRKFADAGFDEVYVQQIGSRARDKVLRGDGDPRYCPRSPATS